MEGPFKVGEVVEAFYIAEDRWVDAEIISVSDGKPYQYTPGYEHLRRHWRLRIAECSRIKSCDERLMRKKKPPTRECDRRVSWEDSIVDRDGKLKVEELVNE